MSTRQSISIRDFNLFCEVMKSTAKIIDSAKLCFSQNGIEIYGARNRIARCEIASNAVYSDAPVEASIADLNMFIKILGTISSVHGDDFSDLKVYVDLPNIKFESKKIKTKFATQTEDVISKWVSKKLETKLEPVFEFSTTGDLLKRVNGHSFIFSDPSSMKITLETRDDMEKNTLFATLGSKDTDLSNEITLKCGLVTFGKLDDRKIVIDAERLGLFTALPASQIQVQLMNMNVLASKAAVSGKNDSFFNLTVYSTILKA